MAKRFDKYLDNMDELREQSDAQVDELLKELSVDVLLRDPEKALKAFVLYFIEKNNSLFNKARFEGQKFAESLK